MDRFRCQKWADAATLLAIVWIPFTAFCIWDATESGRSPALPNLLIDLSVWLFHAGIIALAVRLRRTEAESDTLAVPGKAVAKIVGHGLLAALLSGVPLPISLMVHFGVHWWLLRVQRRAWAGGPERRWYETLPRVEVNVQRIDGRPLRVQYAELLRHFAAGVVTVEEFEEGEAELRQTTATFTERRAMDGAFVAAWSCYDDFRTERLRGEWALTQEARRALVRWVLFLQTDLPYAERPDNDYRAIDWLLILATAGIWSRVARRRWQAREDEINRVYDPAVWPFTTAAALANAREHPRLLCAQPA